MSLLKYVLLDKMARFFNNLLGGPSGALERIAVDLAEGD